MKKLLEISSDNHVLEIKMNIDSYSDIADISNTISVLMKKIAQDYNDSPIKYTHREIKG